MFQLYKQRNFSALINDTISFFKAYGRSYFKNYFLINGGLILILLLLMYLVGSVFVDTIFSSIGNPTGGDKIIEDYFNSNVGLFIGSGIVAMILLLLLSLLSYSYPVIFFNLLEKKAIPTSKQIANALWGKAGKIITFGLLWLVTFLPILILGGLLSIVLIVIIIGIPFAIIIFAAISSWTYLSFFDYLNNKTGYFEAMKNGWNLLFQNFWHHIGSTAIFYFVVSTVHSIISFIPYIIGIAGIFADTATSPEAEPDPEMLSFAGIMILITFMLSVTLAYVLGNIMWVNQGIIYYSAREENENLSLHSEIDLIGSDSE